MEAIPVLHIKYEDKEYTFDLEEITLSQARIMKDRCDLTLMGLEEGLGNGDPDAMRAMYWLMKCQNGEPEDIDRVDFKVVKFARAIDAAQKDEVPDADPKENSDSPA